MFLEKMDKWRANQLYCWKHRKYNEAKLTENIDAEIMQVILEEARESYEPEIVIELQSDNADEVESNVERIKTWYEAWVKNNNVLGDDE